MKIAVDIDDTITAAPEFFAAFCKAMRKDGHEIHIVTASHEMLKETRRKDIERLGIEYDFLVCTNFKDNYCHEEGIDYAFDDMPLHYPNETGTLIRFIKIEKN